MNAKILYKCTAFYYLYQNEIDLDKVYASEICDIWKKWQKLKFSIFRKTSWTPKDILGSNRAGFSTLGISNLPRTHFINLNKTGFRWMASWYVWVEGAWVFHGLCGILQTYQIGFLFATAKIKLGMKVIWFNENKKLNSKWGRGGGGEERPNHREVRTGRKVPSSRLINRR